MRTKTYYKVKLVIYIITGGALVLMFAMCMYSEHVNTTFLNKADNSQHISENFSATIDKIKVDIVGYPVFIETYEGNQIIVELNIKNSSFKDAIAVTISEGTLKIRQTKRIIYGRATFGTGNLIVKVPATSNYDYDIELVQADMKMYAQAKDVQMDGVDSIIEVFAPIEKLHANTTSGTISLIADRSSRDFTFDSVGADIEISLVDTMGYAITADLKGCDIVDVYRDSKTSSDKAFYTHGDGTLAITIDTTGGHVRLGDWQ